MVTHRGALKCNLSYETAVIQLLTSFQWLTSCHKNCLTTRIITLWCEPVTSLTASMSTTHFLNEIMFILNVIKSHFKGSYDKQNLTLVVVSYEIYETCQRLVSLISYEMATCVRSSIYDHKTNSLPPEMTIFNTCPHSNAFSHILIC